MNRITVSSPFASKTKTILKDTKGGILRNHLLKETERRACGLPRLVAVIEEQVDSEPTNNRGASPAAEIEQFVALAEKSSVQQYPRHSSVPSNTATQLGDTYTRLYQTVTRWL